MYFPLGVLLAAVLFPHRRPYAYGVLVMGVSDAAASSVGQRWGRRSFRLVPSASRPRVAEAWTNVLLSVGAAARLSVVT